MDARGTDRGEEVAQVEAEYNGASRVRRNAGRDGAAATVAVGSLVRWDEIEEVVQQPALDRTEPALGDFKQASPAVGLCQPAIGVVMQRAGRGAALETAAVGESVQFFRCDSQPLCEGASG